MKQLCKRSLALLMVLVMLVGFLPALTIQTNAASYTYNWGTRGTVADEDDFTRSTAEEWYAAQGTSYEELSQLLGSATSSAVPTSQMYRELRSLMRGAVTDTTSYEDIKSLCKYTDCQNGGGKISSFYSGTSIGPTWDGSWNREHTWPNSKGDNNGSGENDIFMLRPTSYAENSSRGSDAYGEGGSYYHPNAESGGKYDLRGDVVRIIMFVYVRWQNISSGTGVLYGTSGVIENREIMLKWMEEDPVDTWELGRNDACQSITGTRNVFVDYPELGFLLFGADVPDDYQSPSGQGNTVSYKITATSNNTSYGTVSLSGKTITATPKSGYYASGYTVTSGSATVTQDGNVFTVNAQSDCTVRINFAARQQVTVSFFVGANETKQSVPAGEAMKLDAAIAPEGYTFVGWTTSKLTADTTTKPANYYTDSFTPTADTILYALYSYVEESGGGGTGDYVKVKTAPADWSGEYLIVNEDKSVIFDGSLTTFDKNGNVQAVTISNHTISAAAGDPYKFTVVPYSNGYSFQGTGGKYFGGASAKNSLDTSDTAVVNTLSLDSSGNAVIKGAGGYVLRYNSDANRFRYYNNTQAVIALYVKDGSAGVTYYTSDPIKCEHTDTTNVPAVAATCTEGGFTAGVQCNDCGSFISGHEAIAALGHKYDNWVTTTAPTCTAAGVQTKTCSACGDKQTQSVAALGHSYNSGVITTPATCTTNGVKTFTCGKCGITKTESVAATGHNYVLSGNTYTCGACGDSYDTYFISFFVPEGVTSINRMEYKEGGIELPDADVPSGEYAYTFAGWATAPVEDTEETPTLYKAEEIFTATEETKLYAVYTYAVGGSGSSDYVLTDIGDISAEDTVVITMSKDGKTYALPNNQSSTPSVQAVTVNGDKLANVPSNELLWSVSGDETGYVFSVYGAENSYLYCINDSKGVRIGNSSSNTFVIEQGYLKHKGVSRFVGVYNGATWRCYTSTSTNIGGQTLGFYVKGDAGVLHYTSVDGGVCSHNAELAVDVAPTLTQLGYTQYICADCGEELYEEDYVNSMKESWNLTLHDNLAVNFQIEVHEALWEDLQIKVTFNGKTEIYTVSNGICKASVAVAASQMADVITVEYVYEEERIFKTYAVKDYADYILDETNGYDAKTMELVQAILNYGGAAQTYFGYNTENLVSDQLSASNIPETVENDMVVSGSAQGVQFYGASLVYRNKIAVRFYFTGSVEGLQFIVDGNEVQPVEKEDGLYYVEIGGILPQNLDQQITVNVADTLTVAYSPMNYMVRMNQKGDTNLQNLMKALYHYHLLAKNFA